MLLMCSHLQCNTTTDRCFGCLSWASKWDRWAGAKRTSCRGCTSICSCHIACGTKRGHTGCYWRFLLNSLEIKNELFHKEKECDWLTCKRLEVFLNSPVKITLAIGGGEMRTTGCGRGTDSTADDCATCTDSSLRFILDPVHCFGSQLYVKTDNNKQCHLGKKKCSKNIRK